MALCEVGPDILKHRDVISIIRRCTLSQTGERLRLLSGLRLLQCPEAIKTTSAWGELPLGRAISAHQSARVLYVLIRAHPESCLQPSVQVSSGDYKAPAKLCIDKGTCQRLVVRFETTFRDDRGPADSPRLLLHVAVALGPSR